MKNQGPEKDYKRIHHQQLALFCYLDSSASRWFILRFPFNYNYQTVKCELFYGYPVILSFTISESGHLRVFDGFKKSNDCVNTVLLFHMNWGEGLLCENFQSDRFETKSIVNLSLQIDVLCH